MTRFGFKGLISSGNWFCRTLIRKAHPQCVPFQPGLLVFRCIIWIIIFYFTIILIYFLSVDWLDLTFSSSLGDAFHSDSATILRLRNDLPIPYSHVYFRIAISMSTLDKQFNDAKKEWKQQSHGPRELRKIKSTFIRSSVDCCVYFCVPSPEVVNVDVSRLQIYQIQSPYPHVVQRNSHISTFRRFDNGLRKVCSVLHEYLAMVYEILFFLLLSFMKIERNGNAWLFGSFLRNQKKRKSTTSRDLKKKRPGRRRPAVSCSAKGSWPTICNQLKTLYGKNGRKREEENKE